MPMGKIPAPPGPRQGQNCSLSLTFAIVSLGLVITFQVHKEVKNRKWSPFPLHFPPKFVRSVRGRFF